MPRGRNITDPRLKIQYTVKCLAYNNWTPWFAERHCDLPGAPHMLWKTLSYVCLLFMFLSWDQGKSSWCRCCRLCTNFNLIIFMTISKQTISWTLSYPFITRQHHLLFCQLINQMVLSNAAQLCRRALTFSHVLTFFELCVKNSAASTRFTPNPGCPAFIAWTDSEWKWCIICNPNCVYNVEKNMTYCKMNRIPKTLNVMFTVEVIRGCSERTDSNEPHHKGKVKPLDCIQNKQQQNHNVTHLSPRNTLSCVNPWL